MIFQIIFLSINNNIIVQKNIGQLLSRQDSMCWVSGFTIMGHVSLLFMYFFKNTVKLALKYTK